MKKHLHFLLAVCMILSMFGAISCSKKDDLEVRVKNDYSLGFNNFTIGPDNFGTVASGETTSYKKIPIGSGSVSGISTDGSKNLNGSYSFSGSGKHRFTISLDASGNLHTAEDK